MGEVNKMGFGIIKNGNIRGPKITMLNTIFVNMTEVLIQTKSVGMANDQTLQPEQGKRDCSGKHAIEQH